MFTSIAVALDLEREGDRALPIVNSLSGLGDVSVELLTVESPRMPDDVEAFELRRRATANGWSADSYRVLHDNDPVRAIIDHLGEQPGALLVMSTTAKSPLKRRFLGSVSEGVLSRIGRPVLLVGPHVPADTDLSRPTLVTCVDSTHAADAALPVITEWMRTFDSRPPWVVEVLPADRPSDIAASHVVESAHVQNLAHSLSSVGVDASWEVLHGADIAERVEEFAGSVAAPILVATSTHWTDDRTHWHSTTRRLVQHTTHPVLVIPARTDQTSHEPGDDAGR